MNLDAIKDATWPLHTRAERSGIIADILAGKATRTGVALLLRNLLPVYQALEAALARQTQPILRPLGHPALARSAALTTDLETLGADAVLLPEATAYAARIEAADSFGLAGHAYTRYLGDLNGGQIMKRRIAACIGDVPIAFHEFPQIDDVRAFARLYRADLDRAVQAEGFADAAREATASFELSIALSEAVRAAAN